MELSQSQIEERPQIIQEEAKNEEPIPIIEPLKKSESGESDIDRVIYIQKLEDLEDKKFSDNLK